MLFLETFQHYFLFSQVHFHEFTHLFRSVLYRNKQLLLLLFIFWVKTIYVMTANICKFIHTSIHLVRLTKSAKSITTKYSHIQHDCDAMQWDVMLCEKEIMNLCGQIFSFGIHFNAYVLVGFKSNSSNNNNNNNCIIRLWWWEEKSIYLCIILFV